MSTVDSFQRRLPYALQRFAIAAVACTALASATLAETGTFIDRRLPDDLRVVSYNIFFDSIFPDTSSTGAAKFARVVNALDADVWALQEVWNHSESQVESLMNGLAPLGGGDSWHAHKSNGTFIVSKFPLSMERTSTIPNEDSVALALVDLPDDRFSTDFYLMSNHWKCCTVAGPFDPVDPFDPNEVERQREADAVAAWTRDLTQLGGFVNLPQGTPIVIAGDLNLVQDPDILDPLGTIITGDIYNNGSRFGLDFNPDWDGTDLTDPRPRHNGNPAGDIVTWIDNGSVFDPDRLDYVVYTDSVMVEANKFVLNTVAMSTADRNATGLERFDITIDNSGIDYDHMPVVVDFRLIADMLPGDFNDDGFVDTADFTLWRDNLNAPAGTLANDVDGGTIGVAQYQTWRANFGAASQPLAAVPEPSSVSCGFFLAIFFNRRRRA